MSRIDAKKLGVLLAVVPMHEDERQAWLKIIPYLRKKDIERLYRLLDNEKTRLEKLTNQYLEQIHAIIDQGNIEEVKKKIAT